MPKRGILWRTLSAGQAARIAELEMHAEDLRQEVARHSVSAIPAPRPQLPAQLAARFSMLRQEIHAIETELGTQLRDDLRPLLVYRPGSGKLPFRHDLRQFSVALDGRPSPSGPDSIFLQTIEAVGADDELRTVKTISLKAAAVATAYRTAHSARLATLKAARQSLEQDLALLLGRESRQPPAQTLQTFLHLADQADAWPSYATYHRAVVQPGLSAAQRRLLFGVAWRGLNRPLPGGDLQPYEGFP